jgi:hypothetical protein
MANLLSDADKEKLGNVFQDLHDTFSRDILVYKEAKKVVINTTMEHNPIYGEYTRSNSAVQSTSLTVPNGSFESDGEAGDGVDLKISPANWTTTNQGQWRTEIVEAGQDAGATNPANADEGTYYLRMKGNVEWSLTSPNLGQIEKDSSYHLTAAIGQSSYYSAGGGLDWGRAIISLHDSDDEKLSELIINSEDLAVDQFNDFSTSFKTENVSGSINKNIKIRITHDDSGVNNKASIWDNVRLVQKTAPKSADDISRTPQYKTIKARIEYASPMNEDPLSASPIDSKLNAMIPQGMVRVKLDKEGFDYISGAKRIDLDGKRFLIDSAVRPHGLFDPKFYTFFLKAVE